MTERHDSIDQTQLDLRVILESIRTSVRAQRMSQASSESSPLARDLSRCLDEIELYRVVSAHWPLQGKTLPQRAVALVNKLVRRYLRWYINPIVEQQNAYNDAVARALRLLAEAYSELSEQLRSIEASTAGSALSPAVPRNAHGGPSVEERPALFIDRAADDSYAALMALVRERAAAEPAARFPELALGEAEAQVRLRQQVSAHWPLQGKTLPQRAVALVNKLVRRYLRWYINPIVEQQNAANTAFTEALNRLIALDLLLRAEVARQRRSWGL